VDTDASRDLVTGVVLLIVVVVAAFFWPPLQSLAIIRFVAKHQLAAMAALFCSVAVAVITANAGRRQRRHDACALTRLAGANRTTAALRIVGI